MKTIVTLTDFSDNSNNGLAFAAELAKRASARLILMHVLQNGDAQEAGQKLKSVEAELKNKFGSELKCEVRVASGNLIDAVEEVTTQQRPDLLVMGTKGATGLKRILIGSNTVNVLAKTTLPVLVIPEAARFEDFNRNGKNRVVLATDLELLKNENTLDILKKISLMMVEPKVRVLSVRPKNTKLTLLSNMERDRLLSFFNPEIESERITVFSDNVMGGLNFYLEKNEDTGLVAMIARDSGFLIQKHYTREMASHTHFPLLVLHDE